MTCLNDRGGMNVAPAITLAAMLGFHSCAGPRNVVVVDQLVSEDRGIYQGLQPLMVVSKSPTAVRVESTAGRSYLGFRLPLAADVRHVYFLHAADEPMWGEVETDDLLASHVREVLMVKRPLRTLFATLSDDELREVLDGVLASDDNGVLEAVIAEIERRGNATWEHDIRRVWRRQPMALAALTVQRRLEGGRCPLTVSVEVTPIEGVRWLALRVTNQDSLQTFTIAGESLHTCLLRLRTADGPVFDNAILDSKDDPDLSGLHTLHSVGPQDTLVIPVVAITAAIPRGTLVAEAAYHPDEMLVRWRRCDDLVVYRTTSDLTID
jgi:hypothetical protein